MTELLPCVQLEFVRPLGPSEGRYVVRFGTTEEAGPDVLDVRAVAARVVTTPSKRRRGDAPGGDALSLVRYTLIRTSDPLPGEDAAREWLASRRADAGVRAQEAQRALAVLNMAIRAYRIAAGDPYAVEVTRADAHAVRFGAGTPRQTFDGEALEWLADRPSSSGPRGVRDGGPDRLGPARAVAAALAGRAAPQGADDLVLRALLDLRHGNPAGAAAGVLAALEVIAAQPGADGARPNERARSLARSMLSSGNVDGTEQAALRALLVELREQLHVATLEQLDAVEPIRRKVVTDSELLIA